jgi:hypothetical protein
MDGDLLSFHRCGCDDCRGGPHNLFLPKEHGSFVANKKYSYVCPHTKRECTFIPEKAAETGQKRKPGWVECRPVKA